MINTNNTIFDCGITLASTLNELGFRAASDPTSFVRDDLVLRLDCQWAGVYRWASISVPHSFRPACILSEQQDQPGPWKLVPHHEGLQWRFDFPVALFETQATSDADMTAAHLLGWALRTRGFVVAAGEVAAADAESIEQSSVDDLITMVPELEGGLSIQVDSHVRQVSVSKNAGRVALVVPLMGAVGDHVSDGRLHWLQATILDSQLLCRMARVTPLAQPGEGLQMEVDLTATPCRLFPALARGGIDGLRQMTRKLVAVTSWLTDPELNCHSLDEFRCAGSPT